MHERLLRHRQPKGSATAMVVLHITALLLDSTNCKGSCGVSFGVGWRLLIGPRPSPSAIPSVGRFRPSLRDLKGFGDGEPTFEKVGYFRASLRDFRKGRVRGCAGRAALATAKIHCRRPTFNFPPSSHPFP